MPAVSARVTMRATLNFRFCPLPGRGHGYLPRPFPGAGREASYNKVGQTLALRQEPEATHMTDDEIRAEYVAAMAPELGNLQRDLQNDLAWLLRKWSEFGELYKDEKPRIALLNRVASNFFYFLQCWFYEDAMLHISRLSDPPETGGSKRPNLTIMRLPLAISDAALREKVETAVAEAHGRCQFARTWRNKRLAHSDLTVLRNGVASALPQVQRTDI